MLANGALTSNQGGEGDIRRKIIDDDLVEGIISLPGQMFYSTSISVSLWFINKNKKNKGKVLFIDAKKIGVMIDRTHKGFTDEEIGNLTNIFEKYQDGVLENCSGFYSVVDLKEISKQNYVLTPGRYIGTSDIEDDGEPFDLKMKRLTSEMRRMFKESHQLEEKINSKLKETGYGND